MIDVEFDGSKAVAKLDALPERVRQEVGVGMGRLVAALAMKVQKEKLNGQVLKVRTGRLKSSIGTDVSETDTQIQGVVSTPVEYAPIHEYGFKGSVDVKAHLREIKKAFGRPIPPKEIEVRAHARMMNLPERSFLRSALREFVDAGVPMEEIDAALKRAVL